MHSPGKGLKSADSSPSKFTDASNGLDTYYDAAEPPKLNMSNPREFPSLSGGPQAQQSQFQATGQVWSTQRATQPTPTPVGRPQAGGATSNQQARTAQDATQDTIDDAFFNPSTIGGTTMDDYRHGGQAGMGQLSGTTQPPPGSVEEFPPLGRDGQAQGLQDRRANLMHNAANGAFNDSNNFNAGKNSIPSFLLLQS
jgi:CCR4-NOT transcription complex subunit 2